MPKSSIAMRTPQPCSVLELGPRARSPAAPPCTIAVSVTSSPSSAGGRPVSASAPRTSSPIPPAESCLPERLTHVTNALGEHALALPAHGLLAGLAQRELAQGR